MSCIKSHKSRIAPLKRSQLISVVIPSYCAEKHLEIVVNGIPEFIDYIIIVDDCSTDGTLQLADRLASINPKIRLIKHEINQGVGGAMLSGYALAFELNSLIVAKMDADNQMDPGFLPDLLKPIINGEADYTKGNRFLMTDMSSMRALRRFGNLGLSFMTKVSSGYWDIFDPTNGFTAIHSNLIPLINKSLIDKRYFFETSMLMQLYLLRAVVKDIPIPIRYADETSHLSEWHSLFSFPSRLLLALVNRIWRQYFLLDFNLVSLYIFSGSIMIGFGTIFGLYHWWRSALLQIPATTGTVMLAVLPIILGVQLLLQAVALDVQMVPRRAIHASVRATRHVEKGQPAYGK
jgi:dolichol-phosphate mannosyltransferase